jgi:ATP-binding cassette subfamily C protein LapB
MRPTQRRPDPPRPAARLPGRGVPSARPGSASRRLAVGRPAARGRPADARAGRARRRTGRHGDAPAARGRWTRSTPPRCPRSCCSMATARLRAARLDAADGSARVLLPETGQGAVTLAARRLAERYTGVTLFVRPHFRFDEPHPAVRPTRKRPLVLGRRAGAARVYRDVLRPLPGQRVRAGLADLHDERLRPRGAQPRVETLWDARGRRRAGARRRFHAALLRSHFVDEASASASI